MTPTPPSQPTHQAHPQRTLAEAIASHDNHFNLVRLLAALAVVLYHVCQLNPVNPGLQDPLTAWVAPVSNLGEIAVCVFFMISGLFVTQSWMRDPQPLRFALRRAARILPGLFICLLSTTLVAVIGFSELGIKGLLTLAPWRFIADSTLLHGLQYIIAPEGLRIAGVLGGQDLNGPLWTLYWEARMYIVLGLIGCSALLPMRIWFMSITLFLLLAAQMLPQVLSGYVWEVHLWSLFLVGALLYCLASQVRIRLVHVVCAIIFVGLNWTRSVAMTPSGFTFFGIALVCAALALWLGTRRSQHQRLGAHLARHDYSYGVYIYHWPVIIMLRAALPPMNATHLLLTTLAILLPLAILSWHWIEAPALRRVRRWLSKH